MSNTDREQELARLLNEARVGTEPAAGARARIRAGLTPRLGASVPPAPFTLGRRKIALIGGGTGAVLAFTVWSLWRPPLPPKTLAPVSSSLSLPQIRGVAVPAVSAPVSAVAPAPAGTNDVTMPSMAPVTGRAPASAESETELELISAMQLALRSGDAAGALTLASRHARRFPRGALTQERDGVRAIAQCRLAAPEARAKLRADFLGKYGASPYAARVKDACQP